MSDFFWTPHSGYHWDRSRRRFFEGWYLRLSLPEVNESLAFMYSIDDPAGQSALSGGAAQILGPSEQYFYSLLPDVSQFWAWRHRLGLGHWQRRMVDSPFLNLGAQYLAPDRFWETVERGYQVTATHHLGCLEDIETGAIVRWEYTVKPVYGWGQPASPQLPTAGWLSYLPILEPGWQILMAHGLATGWAEWQGKRYEFTAAPTYAEKNWGGAFPERWFWMQCNTFGEEPDLTVTATGARRQVLTRTETVGLIGLHFRGQFIALNSLTAQVSWHVAAWGAWQMMAQDHRYRICLRGQVDHPPVTVRVPTLAGLKFACWDTAYGHLHVQVWQRFSSASEVSILEATGTLAGLEVGGQGWERSWLFNASNFAKTALKIAD